MIEVNLELMTRAAREAVAQGNDSPLVLSVATWGRGCRPAMLRELERYRYASGFNGSIVAVVPRERAGELLGDAGWSDPGTPGPGNFQAVGVAFKRCFSERLPL
ncbi:MAG: hypothetical protein HY319_13090 [Armatimonadetes bacterium]|nr:hypothetical protein [Armatimonadota bacterium]